MRCDELTQTIDTVALAAVRFARLGGRAEHNSCKLTNHLELPVVEILRHGFRHGRFGLVDRNDQGNRGRIQEDFAFEIVERVRPGS